MDPHRQRALAAGHDGEHQDAIDDLMEIWGADAVKRDGEFEYLYRDNEYLTYFERKR